MPYEQHLKLMDLPSLVYRQCRGDMIEVYKYMHGNYSAPTNSILKKSFTICTARSQLQAIKETLKLSAQTSVLLLSCCQLTEQSSTGSCFSSVIKCLQRKT